MWSGRLADATFALAFLCDCEQTFEEDGRRVKRRVARLGLGGLHHAPCRIRFFIDWERDMIPRGSPKQLTMLRVSQVRGTNEARECRATTNGLFLPGAAASEKGNGQSRRSHVGQA